MVLSTKTRKIDLQGMVATMLKAAAWATLAAADPRRTWPKLGSTEATSTGPLTVQRIGSLERIERVIRGGMGACKVAQFVQMTLLLAHVPVQTFGQ
jgi:hypothetical protein